MNKEKFKKKDIQEWNEIISRQERRTSPEGLKIIENDAGLIFPSKTFYSLLVDKNYNYSDFLPFEIRVYTFDPKKENSYWLKYTNYVAYTDEDNSTFRLKKGVKHSQLSLLWLLLHEFRHRLQFKLPIIESNTWNKNLEYLMKYIEDKGNDKDMIVHVFHEILPYEVDANMFACELLGIEYPGSKFEINDYTLGLLK